MLEEQIELRKIYSLKDGRRFKVQSKHDGMAYGYVVTDDGELREYGYYPYSDLRRAGANNDVQADDDGAAQSSEGSVDGAGSDSPTGLL